MPSFDVVVKVNAQEVLNAVDQVKKEFTTRYDFKGSKASVELKEKEQEIIILADDDMKLSALQEMIKQKLAKRGVSLKSVTFDPETPAGGNMLRQVVKVKQALTSEELKRLSKTVKDEKLKVNVSIQGDQLRVVGKSRDELQGCIQFLKSKIDDLDLQFENFRD